MKVEGLCDSDLKGFLYKVFDDCPNEHFVEGPRSSSLRFNLGINVKEVRNHDVSFLARMGLESNVYNTAHTNVQMFMLAYDNKTVAMEVPIWIHAKELNNFEHMLRSKKPLSGHIDVLRVEDDKIWIWDFKPNAHNEKYAATQVFFYALMLSKRTGIPLEKFMCGYFDDKTAFVFKPELRLID
jgi:hypothetical protein